MKISSFIAALSITSLSGYASIVSSTNQPVSVETRVAGDAVAGAACKLSSNKGTWFVTTPGSIVVHRDFHDLVVECSKAGLTPTSHRQRVRALSATSCSAASSASLSILVPAAPTTIRT